MAVLVITPRKDFPFDCDCEYMLALATYAQECLVIKASKWPNKTVSRIFIV